MRRVDLEKAEVFYWEHPLSDAHENEMSVSQAEHWFAGAIIRGMRRGGGAAGDKYGDGPIIAHFADTLRQLDELDLEEDDRVLVTYNHDTDIWDVEEAQM